MGAKGFSGLSDARVTLTGTGELDPVLFMLSIAARAFLCWPALGIGRPFPSKARWSLMGVDLC